MRTNLALLWLVVWLSVFTRGGAHAQELSPCEAQLAEVWSSLALTASSEGTLSLETQVDRTHARHLIAMVPDPSETGATSVFDRAIAGVAEAVVAEGYRRDRYFIPWTTPQQGHETDRAACARNLPGLMLFRKEQRVLAVWLVGESSVFGPQIGALRWAIDRAAHSESTHGSSLTSVEQYALDVNFRPPSECCVGPKAGREKVQPSASSRATATSLPNPPLRGVVRILGPYYSGSQQNLQKIVRERQGERTGRGQRELLFRVISGSVQAPKHRKDAFVWEQTLAASTTDRLNALRAFLDRGSLNNLDKYPFVLLSETGTALGDVSKVKLHELSFPPHVSALSETLTKDEAKRTSALSQVIAPKDVVPTLSAGREGAHAVEIEQLTTTLRDDRRTEVAVLATAPEDSVYLTRWLRRTSPDLRVSILSHDALYLHSSLTAELEGALVVSGYPFLGDLVRAAPPHKSQARHPTLHTLSRESAVGIYRAGRLLLAGAFTDHYQKNLSVGVIAREHFWPLTLTHEPGHSHVPDTLFWISLLVFGIAVTLVRFSFLESRSSTQAKRDHGVRAPRPFGAFRACKDEELASWQKVLEVGAHIATFIACSVLLALCASVVVLRGQGLAFWVSAIFAGMLCLCAVASLTTSGLLLTGVFQRQIHTHANRWPRYTGWGVFALGSIIGGLSGYGVFMGGCEQVAWSCSARGAFIERAARLTSGVSPVLVLLVFCACAFLYCHVHADRLRALDARPKTDDKKSLLVSHFQSLEDEENALLRSVTRPGDSFGYWSVLASFVLVSAFLLLLARPLDLPTHLLDWITNMTVEGTPLSFMLNLCIACGGAMFAIAVAQFVRYARSLFELLEGVRYEQVAEAARALPAPQRRSVAEMLSSGRASSAEVRLAKELGSSARNGTAATNSNAAASDHSATSVTKSAPKGAASSDSAEPPKTDKDLERAQSLSRVLGVYVKQVRFYITVLSTCVVAMTLTTTFYAFSARRALLAICFLLTAAVVTTCGYVLIRLERHPALKPLGRESTNTGALVTASGQALRWIVVPAMVALASYFPQISARVRQLVDLVGVSG